MTRGAFHLPNAMPHAILAAMLKPARPPIRLTLASLLITLIYPASNLHATVLRGSDQTPFTATSDTLATPAITKALFRRAAHVGCSQ